MCFRFKVVSHRGIDKSHFTESRKVCTNDNLQYGIILQKLLLSGILKVELSPSKKNLCYLLDQKDFKNYEKCFLFHLKSSFGSKDI